MKRDAKTKVLPIRLSPRLYARLQKVAFRNGVGVSEVLRRYAYEGLREDGF